MSAIHYHSYCVLRERVSFYRQVKVAFELIFCKDDSIWCRTVKVVLGVGTREGISRGSQHSDITFDNIQEESNFLNIFKRG